MYRLILVMIALVVSLQTAAAQTDVPKEIKGGVLNGKAVKLPKPIYPMELSGTGEKGTR